MFFLVMGITGRVGGATARELLDKGHHVRSLVRSRAKAASWETEGVELIDGAWDDAEAMSRALHNVDGAYIMLPAVYTPSRDFAESKAVIAAYHRALSDVPPSRVVALSSLGADESSGLGAITPLALMEKAFRDLSIPSVFIRAGGFFENFLYGLHAAKGGTLPVFYEPTSRPLAMIATQDIGRQAARLLTGAAWTGRRVIELCSMVSPDQIAEELGSVLGRDVVAQPIARAAWTQALEQMGFPHGQTWAFEEMTESLNSGWIKSGIEGTERLSGSTPAHDVFAAQHAAEVQHS